MSMDGTETEPRRVAREAELAFSNSLIEWGGPVRTAESKARGARSRIEAIDKMVELLTPGRFGPKAGEQELRIGVAENRNSPELTVKLHDVLGERWKEWFAARRAEAMVELEEAVREYAAAVYEALPDHRPANVVVTNGKARKIDL
jgi:hypothetical protein